MYNGLEFIFSMSRDLNQKRRITICGTEGLCRMILRSPSDFFFFSFVSVPYSKIAFPIFLFFIFYFFGIFFLQKPQQKGDSSSRLDLYVLYHSLPYSLPRYLKTLHILCFSLSPSFLSLPTFPLVPPIRGSRKASSSLQEKKRK